MEDGDHEDLQLPGRDAEVDGDSDMQVEEGGALEDNDEDMEGEGMDVDAPAGGSEAEVESSDGSVQGDVLVQDRRDDTGNSDSEEDDVGDRFTADFIAALAKHPGTSRAFCDTMLTFMREHCEDIHKLQESIPCMKTIDRKIIAKIPKIFLNVTVLDKRSGAIVTDRGLAVFPKKKYSDPAKFELRNIETYMHFADVVQFHKSLSRAHRGDVVILGNDGVPVDLSSGRSFDVMAVRFPGCRNVYPIKVNLCFNKACLDVDTVMSGFLADLKEARCRLKCVICDLPKRSDLMGLRRYGAYYGCTKCLIRGEYNYEIKKVVYPTGEAPARTTTSVMATACDPQFESKLRNSRRNVEELKGVIGKSPFLAVDAPFDLVSDFPTDYQHGLCLGIGRDLFRKLFHVGDAPKTNLVRQSVAMFDQRIVTVKVPTEIPRKTRAMDHAHYKANEWRSLLLYFSPVVMSVLTAHPAGLLPRDIWAYLTFITRAVLINDDDYNVLVQEVHFPDVIETFQKLCQSYLGKAHMTMNMHQVAHLPAVRDRFGALSTVSAFPFEGSFKQLKEGYCKGTMSVAKQGLTSVYHRFFARTHKCSPTCEFSPKIAHKTRDDVVYTGDKKFHRVTDVESRGNLTWLKIEPLKTAPFQYWCQSGDLLDFTTVGMYKIVAHVAQEDEYQWVNVNQLHGKGIIVEDHVVSAPLAMLGECS